VLEILKKVARRVVLLSGTPALSKPAELFPQIMGLLPDAKLSKKELAERYCMGDRFDMCKGCRQENSNELNTMLVRCLLRLAKCNLGQSPQALLLQIA
jgi:SWI/SNF-related matrix-associated actin-dependent regulator of chromatin subfamily A-like protein 1